MRHFIEKLNRNLFCVCCGVGIGRTHNRNIFCSFCEMSIKNQGTGIVNPLAVNNEINITCSKNEVPKIKTYSLFNWNAQNGRFCSAAVRALKGCEENSYYEAIAVELVSNLRLHEFVFGSTILIPAPTQNSDGNHALGLAKGLQRWTGAPILNCLENKVTSVQKGLSLIERAQKSIRVVAGGSIPEDCKNIILVDDVITTGATIRAMRKCIYDSMTNKKAPEFRAIAIFRRQKLR